MCRSCAAGAAPALPASLHIEGEIVAGSVSDQRGASRFRAGRPAPGSCLAAQRRRHWQATVGSSEAATVRNPTGSDSAHSARLPARSGCTQSERPA